MRATASTELRLEAIQSVVQDPAVVFVAGPEVKVARSRETSLLCAEAFLRVRLITASGASNRSSVFKVSARRGSAALLAPMTSRVSSQSKSGCA
jgi:hypothetical protein